MNDPEVKIKRTGFLKYEATVNPKFSETEEEHEELLKRIRREGSILGWLLVAALIFVLWLFYSIVQRAEEQQLPQLGDTRCPNWEVVYSPVKQEIIGVRCK